MKVIVYKNGNGISILTPIMPIEDCVKTLPHGTEYKLIDDSEIPSDRTFRDAWDYDFNEDISKAKEIWKNKLRVDRAPLLDALDIDYMKAQEAGDDAAQETVVAQKQVLRDITKKVDAAKTISGIKKVVL